MYSVCSTSSKTRTTSQTSIFLSPISRNCSGQPSERYNMAPFLSSDDGRSVASLRTINFAALEDGDRSEVDKLLAASVEYGFFYLDFAKSTVASLPTGKEKLFRLMENYFCQPIDAKMLDSQGKPTRGYVSGGTFSAIDRAKPNESFEHLAIGSYELRQDISKTLPLQFQKNCSLTSYYISTCEYIVDVLLHRLSDVLDLKGDLNLAQDHCHDKPSDTILALLSYPGQLTHQKHTDLGSLTVLFSDQWGLQVIAPQTSQWEWVEPRVNHAVINIGDTLRFLSGKKLYSCVHRVTREGRAGEEGHRYSIAYLLRPNDTTEFSDADDAHTTAKEFVSTKYSAYCATYAEQEKNAVLTGGMEQVLGVHG
ncbi:hypothetical protein ONS95_001189 [Cadophora gregata]|uniref:uncharacterized protein n=1 Tax=Cadophora gregata TaxID=51156 RepID=UPI0026DB6760|nr:uncharacterized protein ONS95_001189 [Cadophora gregata]KAK0102005.1 hypothetical protein ONS96_005973 [Cadophora gregata f. sp. sojae]KAK0129254.1 hypothetical protein ONS95_001189 [Cadophora gregata]